MVRKGKSNTGRAAAGKKSPSVTKESKSSQKRKAGSGMSVKAAQNSTVTEVNVKATKKRTNLSHRDEMIQKIKTKLLRQREALLSGAESALNELPGQTMFPDLGDQATAETDRNFMLRLRGREQRLLKKIDEAIERIDNGTFGICDDCGNEIDIKRLDARPVTTMCIECKTLQEEEEKLRET
jgi:DnaK suppressor protein